MSATNLPDVLCALETLDKVFCLAVKVHPAGCDCHLCKAWDGIQKARNELEDHRVRKCLCHHIAQVTAKVQREGGIK